MRKCEILEFSKLYKRVLNVEIALKNKIMYVLRETYPNKEFNRLVPFLTKTISHKKYIMKTSKNKFRDKINDILSSKKSQEEKLLKFFNITYLSDTLKIITQYKSITKDKRFKNNFYSQPQSQNIINNHAANLNKLRNLIMHFNYNEYCQNKEKLTKSLIFWECLLYCPNSFMYNLPKIKPSTKNILTQLSQNCPNFFEMDDRIICDMFDDLAILNGKPINELPHLWTIGRQIYSLKKEFNNK